MDLGEEKFYYVPTAAPGANWRARETSQGGGERRDEGKSSTLSSCVRSVILKSVVCLILIAVYIDLSESAA